MRIIPDSEQLKWHEYRSLVPKGLIDEIVENGRELKMEAEDIVKLVINSPDPELTIDEFIELKKQSIVKEIDENFDPRGKIMTVAKLAEGINFIEAGMTVLENIDSDEQSVATTRKSLQNTLCCYARLVRGGKKIVGSSFIVR